MNGLALTLYPSSAERDGAEAPLTLAPKAHAIVVLDQAGRIFGSYEAIVAAACDAWNSLVGDPARIASIGTRQWATIAGD
ncbi:MAG: hypothetical protein AB7H90_20225 [Alphaproteobacteria bacterium]